MTDPVDPWSTFRKNFSFASFDVTLEDVNCPFRTLLIKNLRNRSHRHTFEDLSRL
jgi:hypothetical protein